MGLQSYKNTILFCLFVILFSGCGDSRNDLSHEQIASKFRAALNSNDVNTIEKLTGLPLMVAEQEWESAQDGIGFVLGARKIEHIHDKKDLRKFLASFTPRVEIEGETAIAVPTTEYSNFKMELGDSIEQWNELKTYLFKRGEGDVEHIVLIGIDSSNNKIHTIYLN